MPYPLNNPHTPRTDQAVGSGASAGGVGAVFAFAFALLFAAGGSLAVRDGRERTSKRTEINIWILGNNIASLTVRYVEGCNWKVPVSIAVLIDLMVPVKEVNAASALSNDLLILSTKSVRLRISLSSPKVWPYTASSSCFTLLILLLRLPSSPKNPSSNAFDLGMMHWFQQTK